MNASVWLMIATDHNQVHPVDGVGVELPDDRIVTVHRSYDAALRYMRHAYDPDGHYEDEGSGSFQNYKALEGYEFQFRSVVL